jgi:hypothetical protein
MKRGLILIVFIGLWTSAGAQFFQGFGVTLGGTYSNQKWKLTNDDNINQRYKLSFNGSVFAELGDHDYARWITEIEYNRKGARQRFPVDDKSAIKANYVSWNNFLKFRQELYDVTPYWYIGPKVEYLINGSLPYSQIHATGATGIGIELLTFDPWIWLLDFQWNPDIMPSLKTDAPLPNENTILTYQRIRHNAFELKLGVKFKGKAKRSSCPAYVDPA